MNMMSKPCSIFNSIEDPYNFGQYQGLSLADVLDINPSYVEWCVYQCDGRHFIISDEAIEQIKKAYPDFKITSNFEYACEQRQADFDFEIYDEVENEARDYIYRNQDPFGRYAGSYAQDEMGYSDDDIDTIFDGDPSAYWNID